MDSTWFVFLPFVAAILVFVFFMMGRAKPCPDCKQPLPRFQSPFTKSRRQWIEGGYLCEHCGCETDIKGNKVIPGTAPSWRSLVVGIALLAVTGIPGLVLLGILLRR